MPLFSRYSLLFSPAFSLRLSHTPPAKMPMTSARLCSGLSSSTSKVSPVSWRSKWKGGEWNEFLRVLGEVLGKMGGADLECDDGKHDTHGLLKVLEVGHGL